MSFLESQFDPIWTYSDDMFINLLDTVRVWSQSSKDARRRMIQHRGGIFSNGQTATDAETKLVRRWYVEGRGRYADFQRIGARMVHRWYAESRISNELVRGWYAESVECFSSLHVESPMQLLSKRP